MGGLQYDKINTTSVVEQTISFLTDAITRRELRPGDKIPTEFELAEKLGVSRNTVREAVKTLVFMGVLEIRRPEGTFVRSGFTESLIDPMVYGIILNQDDSFEGLLQLREIMEVGAMRLVIEKASDEEIESLRGLLSKLEEACKAENPDVDTIFDADNAFHDAINVLSGNQMVNRISSIVRTLTHAMRYESVEVMVGKDDAETLYAAHEKIFDVLKKRSLNDLNHVIRSTYFVDGQALC